MAKNKKIDINAIQDKIFTPKGLMIGLAVVLILFVGSLIQQSCVPKKANILYSICSNFLELHVTFPQSIRETDIELYRKAVRIYYTQVDSFGQERMETIECSFVQDPVQGVQVDTILFDSVKDISSSTIKKGTGRFYQVRPDVVERFNQSGSPRAILNMDKDLGVSKETTIRRY